MSFQQDVVAFLTSSAYFKKHFGENTPSISWQINFDDYLSFSSSSDFDDQVITLRYDFGFYTYAEIDTFMKGKKAFSKIGDIVLEDAEDLPSGVESINKIYPTRIKLVYKNHFLVEGFVNKTNLEKINNCLAEILALKDVQKSIVMSRTKTMPFN